MKPVYLHGRALVSALGADLPHALSTLASGGVKPGRVALPGGTDWPYFTIDNTEPDWRSRARQIIEAAIKEAGVETCRDAPLFVASSSLEIGSLEIDPPLTVPHETATQHGAGGGDDCLTFAEEIAGWLGWRGPVYLVSTACTSALQAMLAAENLISSGAAKEAVVLGVELRNRFSISGFAAMQLLTPTEPKPLGAGRNGIALGEAVAVLHLSGDQNMSGKPARWRMRGGASLVDGRDPTGSLPQSVAQMCGQALAAAGLEPGDIDLIKLQAAGSQAGDVNELAGLAEAFIQMPALITLKAAIGHTLGASGAAEIALLTALLENNIWPHLSYASDPDIIPRLTVSKTESVRYLLAEILGFGGGYASVILEDTLITGI